MNAAAQPRASRTLSYTGLLETEWSAIARFFEAALGRSLNFTFLDPTDNLLAWSEDMTAAIWNVDPLLAVTPEGEGPFGGSRAIQILNSGQAAQSLTQAVAAPGWFHYCFSVYVRADTTCSINLVRRTASDEIREPKVVGSTWTRVTMSRAMANEDDGVTFGIELPAAAGVFAYGAQLEAQPAAGAYKPTLDRSGVYPRSRFDQDVLMQTATAAGQYSTTLRITAAY
jgi:hypothetical protein